MESSWMVRVPSGVIVPINRRSAPKEAARINWVALKQFPSARALSDKLFTQGAAVLLAFRRSISVLLQSAIFHLNGIWRKPDHRTRFYFLRKKHKPPSSLSSLALKFTPAFNRGQVQPSVVSLSKFLFYFLVPHNLTLTGMSNQSDHVTFCTCVCVWMLVICTCAIPFPANPTACINILFGPF